MKEGYGLRGLLDRPIMLTRCQAFLGWHIPSHHLSYHMSSEVHFHSSDQNSNIKREREREKNLN